MKSAIWNGFRGSTAVVLALFAANSAQGQESMVTRIQAIAAGRCVAYGVPADAQTLQTATDIVNAVEQQNEQSVSAGMLALNVAILEARSNPSLDRRTLDLFRAAVERELRQNASEILKSEACVYAQHYSPDELKQLRTFYQSPLGKKVVASEMGISADMVQLGMELAHSDMGRAAAERARQELRAEGVRI